MRIKESKVFYDFQYLDGAQKRYFMGICMGDTKSTIEMISLGMAIDDGSENPTIIYYINKDFNIDEAWRKGINDTGFRNSVLKSLWASLELKDYLIVSGSDEVVRFNTLHNFENKIKHEFTKSRLKYLVNEYGIDLQTIRRNIKSHLNEYDRVSLYSYRGHNNHTLLTNIMEGVDGISDYTYDLKPYIDDYLIKFARDNEYFTKNLFTVNGTLSLSSVLKYVEDKGIYPKILYGEVSNPFYKSEWLMTLHNFLLENDIHINSEVNIL